MQSKIDGIHRLKQEKKFIKKIAEVVHECGNAYPTHTVDISKSVVHKVE